MRKPINKIARNIGMQNQYLSHAITDKHVIGELAIGGNYHSDKSWVDIDSVKEYIKWKCECYFITKEQYESYLLFLNNLTE